MYPKMDEMKTYLTMNAKREDITESERAAMSIILGFLEREEKWYKNKVREIQERFNAEIAMEWEDNYPVSGFHYALDVTEYKTFTEIAMIVKSEDHEEDVCSVVIHEDEKKFQFQSIKEGMEDVELTSVDALTGYVEKTFQSEEFYKMKRNLRQNHI